MFKGHPKGLFVLALSNMGERFGYYTMLAIFSLYLQDSYGWDEGRAANLYGIFLAGIYFLPLLGGIPHGVLRAGDIGLGVKLMNDR